MKKRHTPEQVIGKLREADAELAVGSKQWVAALGLSFRGTQLVGWKQARLRKPAEGGMTMKCYTRCIGICWLAVILLLSAAAGMLTADEATNVKEALVKHIVAKTGVPQGIAFDLGCGDAGLAIELAKQTNLRIYCVDRDERSVAAARLRIDEAGFYGTRIAVERGDFSRLPYPDVWANLIVCGDEFVKGKGGRDFKELYRVLSPNGVAFIGQSSAAAQTGQVLTRAQLESWLQEADIKTYEILEENGIWAKITREPLPGADEWTHRSHDPGNTLGSSDTVAPPFRVQWANQATPGLGGSIVLVAGGRQFVLSYGYKEHPADKVPSIHAYDAYNGVLLWSREGKEELPIDRSLMHYNPCHVSSDAVATADALYVLGGKECAVFDAATGEIVRAIPIPSEVEAGAGDIWLYLAYADGVLLGGIGAAPKIEKPEKYGAMLMRGECHTVLAVDPRSGQVQWTSPYLLKTNSLVVGEGKLYFLDTEMVLHALDLRTGARVWSGREPALPPQTLVKRVVYYRGKLWVLGWKAEWARRGRPWNYGVGKCVRVYSAKDSRHLFDPEFPIVSEYTKKAHTTPMFSYLNFAGDFAICSTGHSTAPKVMVDVETGKARWAKKLRVGGCAPLTATAGYVFGRSNFVDLETDEGGSYGPLRATCHISAIPANGMVYVPAPGCACGYGFRGNLVLIPGTVPEPDTEAARLVKGPAFGEEVPETGQAAWVSWRNGPTRSGRAAETVAPPLEKLWAMPMADVTTPVAVGGGLIFCGSMDYKLCAFDVASGKKKWQYIADGAIRIAPWLWKGRLYVGDDDGWVHCVRAPDGALIWKFWAALADDRTFANGRLCSRWRAGCGVLVDEGTAYFTAGFFPPDKTAIYALDARTGDLRQQLIPAGKSGIPASGVLALAGDQLYIASEWEYASGVTLKGSEAWTIRKIGGRTRGTPRGSHIMVVGDRLLLRSPDLEIVSYARVYLDWRATLPIITEDSIYLRNGCWMTAERLDALKIVESYWKGTYRLFPVNKPEQEPTWMKHSRYYRATRDEKQPTPETLRWSAWQDEPMTAIIMAGDVLLSGGHGKVYATAAADGKELWSAEVPGEVVDLAFQDQRLFVVCRQPDALVCFQSAP